MYHRSRSPRLKHAIGMALVLNLTLGFLAHAAAGVTMIGPPEAKGIESYTCRELCRVFREHRDVDVGAIEGTEIPEDIDNLIVIGTAKNNPFLQKLQQKGFFRPEEHREGYAIKCAPNPKKDGAWILVVAGSDNRGALYGLRDLEHYCLKHFSARNGRLHAEPFERRDYPRIEHRGHWIWGCNMPDKKAWLENMSRWKLNELIHWDNYPPEKAKEYVDYAHERGIRVVWGFGWGWMPSWNFDLPKEFDRGTKDMCASSEFNRAFFKKAIVKKVRDLYAPTGADGIYFQTFTEGRFCECEKCAAKTRDELVLSFLSPIIAAVQKEFPDLWISCGIHGSPKSYPALKDLAPRCNIYWENCGSGPSIRGGNEDFGFIHKKLPYCHGFSKSCPADPPFTEETLIKRMNRSARTYELRGSIDTYYAFMKQQQGWAGNFLKNNSSNKHATVVADGSLFCRRTPFMHVALAEACWNPELDTVATVDAITEFLGIAAEISRREKAAIVHHLAVGKQVKLATEPHRKHKGGGPQGLTNGKLAQWETISDPEWQGYEGADFEAIVDLGRVRAISGLSSRYLQHERKGALFPKSVQYAVSKDGQDFQVVKTPGNDAPADPKKSREPLIRWFTIEGLDLDARYVRVRATNVGMLPKKRDRKALLLVDEIMVNPIGGE